MTEGAEGRDLARNVYSLKSKDCIRARKSLGFIAQRSKMNSPGLNDEGVLPRVNETTPTTVRYSMLKNVIGYFRTEGTQG